jgi:hypothetical protein
LDGRQQLDDGRSGTPVLGQEVGAEMRVRLDELLLERQRLRRVGAVPGEAPVVISGYEDLPRTGGVQELTQDALAALAVVRLESGGIDVVAQEHHRGVVRLFVGPLSDERERRIRRRFGCARVADEDQAIVGGNLLFGKLREGVGAKGIPIRSVARPAQARTPSDVEEQRGAQ